MTLQRFILTFLLVTSIFDYGYIKPSIFSIDPVLQQETSLNVPFHSQAIESARYIKLGTSEYSLFDKGCAVASTAMIFSYYGIETDVISINDLFTPNGFVNGYAFNWESIPEKSNNKLTAAAIWTNNPNSQRNSIQNELLEGRPVISRINLSGDTHFVVIVAFNQKGDFLINDPGKPSAKQGKEIPFDENILGASFSLVDEFVFIYPFEDYIFNTGIKIPEPILSEFYKMGGVRGNLGTPITDAKNIEGTEFLFQEFESGGIFEVNGNLISLFGPIWGFYKQNGGIKKYGIPKHTLYEEYINGNIHQRADFDNYSLDWSIWDNPNQVDELNYDNAFFTEFFSNSNLSGTPIYTRFDKEIDFMWGNASPIPDLNLLEYSVRFYEKTLNAIPLVLNFTGDIGGKFRIIIDGDVVNNNENQKYFEFSKLLWGQRPVEIEFEKTDKPATIRFSWRPWPLPKKVYAENEEGNPLLVLPVSICELDCYKNEEFCIENLSDNSDCLDEQKKIVFASQGKHKEIFIMNTDGENLRQITPPGMNNYRPAISPDGSLIAYISIISIAEGNYQIFVMNVDGGNQHQFTVNSVNYNCWPIWSPDGSSIAFTAYHNKREQIFILDVDGNILRQLTFNDINVLPDWSPDGSLMTFMSHRDGDAEIFIMDADGNDQRQLTFNGGNSNPLWSPDGTEIAFGHSPALYENNELFIMDADGNNQHQLSDSGCNILPPFSWSPDGYEIAFSADCEGDSEIFLIERDGSNEQRLTFNNFNDKSPKWSTDGSMIIFMSDRDGDYEIYKMDANGINQHQLTYNEGDELSFSLSPGCDH